MITRINLLAALALLPVLVAGPVPSLLDHPGPQPAPADLQTEDGSPASVTCTIFQDWLETDSWY